MSNEVMKINPTLGAIAMTDTGVKMNDLAQVYAFSEMMEEAGWLPKGVTKKGAAIAIIAGRALGLDPFAAVQGIAPVNNRPTLWGDAMVGVVKASGLVEDEQVEYLKDDLSCRYTIKRKGVATPYVGTFSKADAERAGLWGKTGPWTQYPKRMLLNRARAFALRDGFADVLKGMRCYEEERDVVEADAVVVETPAPQRKRASAAEVLAAPTNDGDTPHMRPDEGRKYPEVVTDAEAKADVAAIPMPM